MIYSVFLRNAKQAEKDRWIGVIAENEFFALFWQCEDESDKEMIEAGYIRVSHENLDGLPSMWAELWEVNNAREKLGQPKILQDEIEV